MTGIMCLWVDGWVIYKNVLKSSRPYLESNELELYVFTYLSTYEQDVLHGQF